ncbi:MAG: aminotransferase class I/II-fold pyridoxal phosphate-dependent enzyme [Clostridia bacterium]|nr:aminotransferase class I/II-fold pyridoxal phosphate-dependent enzyme [Clostridia bacterium]
MSVNPASFINEKVKSIPPSGIRKFFDLISQTEGVISLGVGEPDFVTPAHIRKACYESLEKGHTMYTSNYGLFELRQAVSKYLTKFDLEYNPENEILITVGVSEAIDLALRAVVSAGDEVLIPDPSYVSYVPSVILAGGNPIPLRTYAKDNFKLTAAELKNKITPKSKVLILTFPNNPTGAIMTKEDLEPIAQIVEEHNLIVISDEVYGELTYTGQHFSFAALPEMWERTITLNGFSKAFAMTGWRIGYAAAPKEILSALVKIHQYTMLCAPIMGQKAALEALTNGEEEMKKMVASYNKRRQLIVNGLREIGLECFEPQGSFYVFPSVKNTGLTSEEFSEKLLIEEKVAVVPGNAFGESGEGFIRCCYAASVDNIKEALVRMNRFLKNL